MFYFLRHVYGVALYLVTPRTHVGDSALYLVLPRHVAVLLCTLSYLAMLAKIVRDLYLVLLVRLLWLTSTKDHMLPDQTPRHVSDVALYLVLPRHVGDVAQPWGINKNLIHRLNLAMLAMLLCTLSYLSPCWRC